MLFRMRLVHYSLIAAQTLVNQVNTVSMITNATVQNGFNLGLTAAVLHFQLLRFWLILRYIIENLKNTFF